MRSRSVGCGTNKRRMQSTTPSFATDHIMLIRVLDEAGNIDVDGLLWHLWG
jgi:hypothetical protein